MLEERIKKTFPAEEENAVKKTSAIKHWAQEEVPVFLSVGEIANQFETADEEQKISLLQKLQPIKELGNEEGIRYATFYENAEEYILQRLHWLSENRDKITDKDRVKQEYSVYLHEQLLSKVGSQKSIDYACEMIKINADVLFEYNISILLTLDPEYSAVKILSILDYIYLNEWQTPQLILMLADLLGTEKLRDKLNLLIEKEKKHDINTNNSERSYALITPCSDKTAITNLKNFYQENIKFEEYKINQEMNAKEVELLQDLIGED